MLVMYNVHMSTNPRTVTDRESTSHYHFPLFIDFSIITYHCIIQILYAMHFLSLFEIQRMICGKKILTISNSKSHVIRSLLYKCNNPRLLQWSHPATKDHSTCSC